MTTLNLKKMANRIKERRENLMYTQEQFSEIINISFSSYTKIENAFQKPSLDTLIKIATHLDVSLDFLVFGKLDNNNNLSDTQILENILNNINSSDLKNVTTLLNQILKLKK